jgi:hypothetical protein
MNESSAGTDTAPQDLDPKIRTRLHEITRPEYVDPARKDLTALDWVAFLGFLLVCAVGAVLWGY